MRDRLIELLKSPHKAEQLRQMGVTIGKYEDDCVEAMIADFLLANGVIVPPCKVGDVVWVNWERYSKSQKETRPVKVYALRFDTKKNNMRICVEGNFKVTAYGGSYTHYYNGTFAWNSVGKSVFLTKEEAEKALAERRAT